MAKIDRVAMELCKLGVTLEHEDNAAGFLGVKLKCDSNTGLLEMKQTGLIERVVEALGLDDGYARGKHTPAETKPLVKDEDGVAAAKGFSYSSVVGIGPMASTLVEILYYSSLHKIQTPLPPKSHW